MAKSWVALVSRCMIKQHETAVTSRAAQVDPFMPKAIGHRGPMKRLLQQILIQQNVAVSVAFTLEIFCSSV